MVILQEFKLEVEPKSDDIECLNHTGNELTKDSPTEEAKVIKAPLVDVNVLWHGLLDGISERQVNCLYSGIMVPQYSPVKTGVEQ